MDKCYMKFEPYGYFSGTPKKVTGTINSKDDKVQFNKTNVIWTFTLLKIYNIFLKT